MINASDARERRRNSRAHDQAGIPLSETFDDIDYIIRMRANEGHPDALIPLALQSNERLNQITATLAERGYMSSMSAMTDRVILLIHWG